MRRADNLPPSRAIVTKSGNLDFLEPSGPVQACNGTALPLHFIIFEIKNLYQFLFQFRRQEEEGFSGSAVGSIK